MVRIFTITLAIQFTISTLCLTAVQALLKYFKSVSGQELMPGIVAVIQTFGDRINFHPHLHILVTEGGTDPNKHFHKITRFHDELIQALFASMVEKILSWRHTGFNLHSQLRAETRSNTERVGKYMIRPLLSLKRLFFDETEGKLTYEYGKDRAHKEKMDYLEFIARVTSHIPEKGQLMVRYYSLYSNAHRGKIRKSREETSPFLIIEKEEPFVPSKAWAEMMRKVYEVEPLLCPSCGGQMSIISLIEDHKVIDRIIAHLKLTFIAERPPPP